MPNSRRAQPWETRQVMYEALITSAITSAELAAEHRSEPRQHHPVLQGQRGAGFDCRVPRAGAPLRLRAAPGPDRSRYGHARARWHRLPRWPCCCKKALAIPSASRSHPSRVKPRTQEVVVASEILQSLGLRMFVPSVTACPAAAVPPAPPSRSWPNRSTTTCAARCPCGDDSTPAWRP